MNEVVTEEEKQRNEREFTRSNQEKLLEVLKELFPTWNWQAIPGDKRDKFDPEHESRTHFLHNNLLHSAFFGDAPSDERLVDERLVTDMLYHSVLFYMSSPEDALDWSEPPRLYYNLGGVERLLVVYRAWARLNSSDSEYERINSLVKSCFV